MMSNAGGYALIALMLGLLVFTTVMLPRFWRHQITTFDGRDDAVGDLTDAVIRTMPVGVLGAWLLVIGVVLAIVRLDGAIGRIIAFAVAGALLIDFGLMLSVWYLNMPRFLVPPYRRGSRGALREPLSGRRHRDADNGRNGREAEH